MQQEPHNPHHTFSELISATKALQTFPLGMENSNAFLSLILIFTNALKNLFCIVIIGQQKVT
jgi:hypothetical protein